MRALAAYSARAGDADATARWIDAYASLGFGEEALNDSAFASVRDNDAVRSALDRLRANLDPAGRSEIAFRLTDSTTFGEGLDCTADGAACLLSDLRNRRVLRLSRGGAPETIAGPEHGLLAPLAIALDHGSELLWIASVPLPLVTRDNPDLADSAATVLAFDLRSRTIVRRLSFPADDAGHEPGAILIAADGIVYVSDSRHPVLYRVPPAGDVLETAATSPLFRSLQGMAESADGRRLYVADYSHGLLTVDRRTGSVERVAVPPRATLLGIDGLAAHGSMLVAVQNGVRPARIVGLSLDPTGLRVTAVEILDRRPDIATEPTTGDIAGDRFFYLANSHWPWYHDDGRLRADARLAPPVVLAVPLGGRR